MYKKERILEEINKIRLEIGHESVEINICKIILKNNELWIIAEDRPNKSAIIGKGGWVVGKLKENLNVDKIHVESYGDFLIKKYELKLAKKRLEKFKENFEPIENLKKLLIEKSNNIYGFDFNEHFKKHSFKEEKTPKAVVALSGGVDSSFSLILGKFLGFNPIAISIDPGTIILPNQFKKNIKKLTNELNVKHEYIKVDYEDIIKGSLNGQFHPCGRCSKLIEKTVYDYCEKNNINIVIFGDMLSTGSQSITKQRENLYRLNLPGTLALKKQEIKKVTEKFELEEFDVFGCPLLHEVHKKYPYMKKFSIQRILRETRTSALEAGESLNLIWSFYKV